MNHVATSLILLRHRNLLQPASTNDAIVAQTTVRPDGLVEATTSSGGTDQEGNGSDVQLAWNEASADDHERALPKSIARGGLETTFS